MAQPDGVCAGRDRRAHAGAISGFPLGLADITVETPFTIHDRPPPPPGEVPSTPISQVTRGYFEAMRIPFRAGRRFDERDDAERPSVAIINETLARQHWPDANPLTERLTVQVFGQAFEAEIVGVVGATRAQGFDSGRRPEVFVPHAQSGTSGSMTYVVRTVGDPAGQPVGDAGSRLGPSIRCRASTASPPPSSSCRTRSRRGASRQRCWCCSP